MFKNISVIRLYKEFAKKFRSVFFKLHQPRDMNTSYVFSCETMFFSKTQASAYKVPVLTEEKNILISGDVLLRKDNGRLLPYYFHVPRVATIYLKSRDYLKARLGESQYLNRAIFYYTPQLGNYYHFIIDFLLRESYVLQAVRESEGKLPVLIPGYSKFSRWQRAYFDLLGMEDQLILDTNKPLFVNKLLTFPPEALCNTSDVSKIQLIREKLVKQAVNKSKPANYKRIYVSRSMARGTGFRGVLNENEFSRFLSNRGFEVLNLEMMPVAEQILAFANAKLVISPHGAGLTNTLFCDDAHVIELCHRDGYWNHAYKGMAELLSLGYTKYESEERLCSKTGQFGIDTVKFGKLLDFIEL